MNRDPYFDSMPERPVVFWATTTRRHLGLWEPLVARHAQQHTELSGVEIWRGEAEHHFVLIAAHHLVSAIKLMGKPVGLDGTTSAELKGTRDLLEHWTGNMPVFNQRPRNQEPEYNSGKAFAKRNPDAGPYSWWRWSPKEGALVTPQVSAARLHQLVDKVIAAALQTRPELEAFVEPRAASPWVERHSDDDEWWPLVT